MGVQAPSTNLPPAASPGAGSRVGFLSIPWKCVGVHRAAPSLPGHGRVPALQQAPQRDGLFWASPSSACQVLLFQCHPLQLQPGAAALWLVEMSRVWLGSAGALPSALAGHHPQASLAPIPGTRSVRGEMLLLGCAAVPRRLRAAPSAKP